MPKKQQKNGYFFYECHFNEKQAIQGQTFYGGKAITASDTWRSMTLQQREPFEQMAKKAKTSQTIPVTINKKEKEAAESTRIMNTTITEMVANSSMNNTIATQEYYFVDGNHFCRTMKNIYYPAELSLIKFTFEDGIVQEFHTFINPGKLPLGYLFDAKDHSFQTHKLPIPPKAMGEKNYAFILQEITKFLGNVTELPPLFASKENIEMIESFLKQLCEVNAKRFRVFPIHQLFFDLKKKATEDADVPGFQSIHDAEAHLNHDKYMYTRSTACQYHEENDCSKFCSLASVKRWAYTFLDHISVDLKISLIAGKHLPIEVDISQVNTSVNTDVWNFSELNNLTATIAETLSNSVATSEVTDPVWHKRSQSIECKSISCDKTDFLLPKSRQQASSPENVTFNIYDPGNTSLDTSYQREDISTSTVNDFTLLDEIRESGRGSFASLHEDNLNERYTSLRGRGRGRGIKAIPHNLSGSSLSGRGRKEGIYGETVDSQGEIYNTTIFDFRYFLEKLQSLESECGGYNEVNQSSSLYRGTGRLREYVRQSFADN